jgi:hypothetical protein
LRFSGIKAATPAPSCTKTKSRDTVGGLKTALVTGTSDRMTAAEWVDPLSEPNDDRFQARAAKVFGVDLYNRPSLYKRSAEVAIAESREMG